MAKDPAFLFYSQDFFTGTAILSFEDKGKFIHIMCLMHQQGRMKEETIRFLVGSVSVTLKNKFTVDEDGFWYNKRLEKEILLRNNFTKSRRDNGSKGGRPKKINDNHMVNHMEDEDIIVLIGLTEEKEISEKNKKQVVMVVLEMYKVWQDLNPVYPKEEERDYPALLQLAYKIAAAKGWKKSQVISSKEFEVIESWRKIANWVITDSWLATKPLSTINGQWQRIYQEMSLKKPKDRLEAKRISHEDYFE